MKNIITLKVEDSVVDYFLNLPNLPNTEEKTSTVNGHQTPNIISVIDSQLISYLKMQYIIPSVKQMMGNYNIDSLRIDHIHHIKYNKQGTQDIHSHELHEDYSFILYLNDCNDGHTIFYNYPKPHILTPKRGEMTIFKSYLYHEGLETNSFKQVIVGGIKEMGKEWLLRDIK